MTEPYLSRRKLLKYSCSIFATAVTSSFFLKQFIRKFEENESPFNFVVTYKFHSPLSLETFKSVKKKWQKKDELYRINGKYFASSEMIGEKFEFAEKECTTTYIFNSRKTFDKWYAEVNSGSAIDETIRSMYISKITTNIDKA